MTSLLPKTSFLNPSSGTRLSKFEKSFNPTPLLLTQLFEQEDKKCCRIGRFGAPSCPLGPLKSQKIFLFFFFRHLTSISPLRNRFRPLRNHFFHLFRPFLELWKKFGGEIFLIWHFLELFGHFCQSMACNSSKRSPQTHTTRTKKLGRWRKHVFFFVFFNTLV